jgi:hypothetical protein
VQHQIKLEGNRRVVAIKGINPDHLFDFEVRIRETFPTVLQVLETTNSRTLNHSNRPYGKFHLLCTKQALLPLAQQLQDKLSQLYTTYLQSQLIDPHEGDEKVEVLSKLPSGPGSETSRNTYSSIYTSRYLESEHWEMDGSAQDTDDSMNHRESTTSPTSIPPGPTSYAHVASIKVPPDGTSANLSSCIVPVQDSLSDGFGSSKPTDIEKRMESMEAMFQTLMQQNHSLSQQNQSLILHTQSLSQQNQSLLQQNQELMKRLDDLTTQSQSLSPIQADSTELISTPVDEAPPLSQPPLSQDFLTPLPWKQAHRNSTTRIEDYFPPILSQQQ